MAYASKVKDAWKKGREYRKGITDLKTEMEVRSEKCVALGLYLMVGRLNYSKTQKLMSRPHLDK